MNKYYLVHSFSKEYGVSPINYLIGRRIEESRYLLADTNHSLSQISHMLGFSSPVTSPRVSVSWKALALWNTGSGSGPRERTSGITTVVLLFIYLYTIVRICFNRL